LAVFKSFGSTNAGYLDEAEEINTPLDLNKGFAIAFGYSNELSVKPISIS